MSYALEIDMIAKARDKDMLTTPYVFSESEAAAMAIAGADIIVCHLGLTTGGAIGAQTALKARGLSRADRRLGQRGAQRQSGHIWCWPMAARSPSPPTPTSS